MNTLTLTNITHLNGIPYNIRVAGVVIKPAKSKKINMSLLKDKDKKLLGTALKVGFESKKTLPELPAMTLSEIKEYLEYLTPEKLKTLSLAAGFSDVASIKKLTRKIFRSEDLDPEIFFWTRKWTLSKGNYIRS